MSENKSTEVIKARIKIGATIGHDFSYSNWPNCRLSKGLNQTEENIKDTIFECTVNSNRTYNCIAPGFGVVGMNSYGDGAITVCKLEDLILVNDIEEVKLNESSEIKSDTSINFECDTYKKYIGTKIVHAFPRFANEKDKRGKYPIGSPGYQVKYKDGYISWSPETEFEEAYIETENLNFGLALEALRNGHKVGNTLWDKSVDGQPYKTFMEIIRLPIDKDFDLYEFSAYEYLNNDISTAYCVGVWNRDITYMLSNDWYILETVDEKIKPSVVIGTKIKLLKDVIADIIGIHQGYICLNKDDEFVIYKFYKSSYICTIYENGIEFVLFEEDFEIITKDRKLNKNKEYTLQLR